MDGTLPRELMLEIFSRLPAIALAQSRSACKQWKSLIDDPCLPDMHSVRASSSEDKEAALFLIKWYDFYHETTTRVEMITEHHTSPKPLLQFLKSGRYASSNSCNGLVCFSMCGEEEEEAFVCNPLMEGGGRFVLPPPKVKSRWPGATRYGLGYDSSTKKYKVVRVYVRSGDRRLYSMGAELYTMGNGATSSWREISQPPDSVPFMPSVYASGALHWPVNFQEDSKKRRVISFDFKQEKFNTIVKEDQFPGWFNLIDLGGHLGVLDMSSETQIEIWKLKEYEKKEWVKEHRIDRLALRGVSVPTIKNFINVGITGGEIYYLADAEGMVGEEAETTLLAAYNTKTNDVKVIHTFRKDKAVVRDGLAMHRGTLVPLPSLDSTF